MNDPEKHPSVPDQNRGRETGAEEKVSCSSVQEAKALFLIASKRLLNINNWDKYSGPLSAKFQLCDGKGNPVERKPSVGDTIRIDLPGPGPTSGKGYDWVKIEEISAEEENDLQSIALRTRPCKDPSTNDPSIAHFYTDSATSTFVVQRIGDTVSAAEKGKNEKINNEDPGILDKLRNTLVGGVASHGGSVPQWKALVTGWLKLAN